MSFDFPSFPGSALQTTAVGIIVALGWSEMIRKSETEPIQPSTLTEYSIGYTPGVIVLSGTSPNSFIGKDHVPPGISVTKIGLGVRLIQ